MSEASDTRRAFRWSWLRHAVQAAALVLFAAPVLAAGWSLFGTSVGGDDAAATPAMALKMEVVRSLTDELFLLQTLGDDRAVRETYVAGKPMKALL